MHTTIYTSRVRINLIKSTCTMEYTMNISWNPYTMFIVTICTVHQYFIRYLCILFFFFYWVLVTDSKNVQRPKSSTRKSFSRVKNHVFMPMNVWQHVYVWTEIAYLCHLRTQTDQNINCKWNGPRGKVIVCATLSSVVIYKSLFIPVLINNFF